MNNFEWALFHGRRALIVSFRSDGLLSPRSVVKSRKPTHETWLPDFHGGLKWNTVGSYLEQRGFRPFPVFDVHGIFWRMECRNIDYDHEGKNGTERTEGL